MTELLPIRLSPFRRVAVLFVADPTCRRFDRIPLTTYMFYWGADPEPGAGQSQPRSRGIYWGIGDVEIWAMEIKKAERAYILHFGTCV